MSDAVGHASAEREEENDEIRQSDAAVDTQRRQHEHGKPCHIERYEAHVAPFVSEQFRELMLEAGQVLFREMQALYNDGHQTHRKDRRGIVLPTGCGPKQISDNQAYAENSGGAAHPAGLCRHNGRHEDSPDDAVPPSHHVHPILYLILIFWGRIPGRK